LIQGDVWGFFTSSDEELGGGLHRRAFSFFADLSSSGSSSGVYKKSQTLATVDVYSG
jgi:hypothetical protein